MASSPRPSLPTFTSPLSSSKRSNAKREKPLSDREYADRVKSYARLATGQHYHGLANYLFSPYQLNVPDVASDKSTQASKTARERFVTMYTLHDQGSPQVRQISTAMEFSQAAAEAEDLSTLLFLRGHQPPEMLNAIGARYRVDPEFFRQHLEMTSQHGRTGSIPLTSLPSTCKNIIRLPSVTLASRSSNSEISQFHQEKLTKMRDETLRLLDNHIDKVLQDRESHLPQGTSIVRNFSVHNYQHFSLEQEISVYVAAYCKGWVGIVWLDTGSDLGQDKSGPWQATALQCESWEIQFHPTIQHQPGAALNSKYLTRMNTGPQVKNEKETSRLLQTAALLHKNYGQHLDYETMIADPFYALTDIFAYVALSEAQFLDLIQLSLDRELYIKLLSRYSQQTRAALWNLVYNKLVLDRHHRRIQGITSFLENYSHIVDWPSATTPAAQKISSDAAERLRMDYKHLIARCRTLYAAFEDAMDILQNNSMIAESQKAIQQAEGVAKLTRLAFFFIPLTLTSSIFGMNLKQFVNGTLLSIWVWVVTSVLTLMLSYLVLNWGNLHGNERVRRMKYNSKEKKAKAQAQAIQSFEMVDKAAINV